MLERPDEAGGAGGGAHVDVVFDLEGGEALLEASRPDPATSPGLASPVPESPLLELSAPGGGAEAPLLELTPPPPAPAPGREVPLPAPPAPLGDLPASEAPAPAPEAPAPAPEAPAPAPDAPAPAPDAPAPAPVSSEAPAPVSSEAPAPAPSDASPHPSGWLATGEETRLTVFELDAPVELPGSRPGSGRFATPSPGSGRFPTPASTNPFSSALGPKEDDATRRTAADLLETARRSRPSARLAVPPPPEPVAGDDPLLGQIIERKYRILEPLGRGGMAAVYRAWHLKLGRVVALKFIRSDAASEERFRERFFREAQITSQLIHPRIVPMREFGETEEGDFFMVLDYVQGRPLSALLDAGRVETSRALLVAAQILDALEAVHAAGIVHGDMKPGNVMLDERGDAWLLDFGLASSREEIAAGERRSIVGTPRYMAPEQAAGGSIGPAVDLFAVGLILYEALCGKLPQEGEVQETMRLRREQAIPPPSEFAPEAGVAPALEAVVMRSLARRPEERWPSAAAFRAALVALSGSSTPSAETAAAPPAAPPSLPPQTQRSESSVAPAAAAEVPSPAPVRAAALLAAVSLVPLLVLLALKAGDAPRSSAEAMGPPPPLVSQAPAPDAAPEPEVADEAAEARDATRAEERLAQVRRALTEVAARCAASRERSQALQGQLRAALADVTIPERWSAAVERVHAAEALQAALPSPSEVDAARLEAGRQACEEVARAWDMACEELAALAEPARQADPRPALAEALQAAGSGGARQLAAAEFDELERRLGEAEGAQGAAALERLAGVRQELAHLTGELLPGRRQALQAEFEALMREAAAAREAGLRSLAEVHLPEEWEHARALEATALGAGDGSPAGGLARRDALRQAVHALSDVAARAQDMNAIKSLVIRLSGTIVRRELEGALRLYVDRDVADKHVLRELCERGDQIRFMTAKPRIAGGEAVADVTAFSYYDRQLNRRVELKDTKLRMSKIDGEWKVTSLLD